MADREPKAWFTTKTGKHIPIFEGETKADALKRAGIADSKPFPLHRLGLLLNSIGRNNDE